MKINERTEQLQNLYNTREKVRALRKGAFEVKNQGEKFLYKDTGEIEHNVKVGEQNSTINPYQNRLKRSVLLNLTKKTVQNLSGKPFSKKINISSKNNQNFIDKKINNIDNNKTSIQKFSKELLNESLWNGFCGIILDIKDKNSYSKIVNADNILSYEENENNECILVRYIESKKVIEGFEVKEVEVVRFWYKNENGVFLEIHEQVKDDEFILLETIEYNMDFIPFILHISDTQECEDLSNCISPVSDIAELNILHYNVFSDQNNILHFTNVPLLTGVGMNPSETQIVVGSDRAIISENENANLFYVEPKGTAINAGFTHIERIEKMMEALGYEFLNNSYTRTATEANMKSEATYSHLTSLIFEIENTMKKILGKMAELELINDFECEIEIFKDFGVKISTEELNALTNARLNKDLSYTNYIKELKRRNIIVQNLDLDKNKEELDKEDNIFETE